MTDLDLDGYRQWLDGMLAQTRDLGEQIAAETDGIVARAARFNLYGDQPDQPPEEHR